MSGTTRTPGGARDILRLAVPALPVLAAEPLYLLVDTAVVGRLGAVPLAGLAVAGVLFAQVTTQLTFLSYGTTARASRFYGAGRRSAAVTEGMQATWLAVAVGLLVIGLGQLVAEPVTRALAGSGEIADGAANWLRIALFGAPMVLITLAGNGWMRGVQDTVRPMRYVIAGNALSAVLCPFLVHGAGDWDGWGLEGSAVANVIAQTVSASFFLWALAVERRRAPASDPIRLAPDTAVLRAQATMGRDLVIRSLGFQACFLSATAVAARFGAGAVAAHQIVLQLWVFQALVLDAVAIAAQALVGSALGAARTAADTVRARAVAARVTRYGLLLGCVFAVVFAALYPVLPGVFTTDALVLATIPAAWWFFTALQPIAGVVFALDGVLLGAGDAAFLRTTTLLAALGGFLPLIWLSLVFGWGLVGIWTGLAAFMLIRLVAVGWRTYSGRWAVPGAVRA
ncbi:MULTISPECIES: MATE family efflux transporter [Pseudonocardia]|uniref:DNA-damage-inducible protein F n=2 Tax=Pseudonocardia TaxID=1847 RepID=A0A1Y2N260_PSEAH|nr:MULTISPECIES: MATE family efflux transporter [Pseudonocardia]OSY41291.1 DNA-damage-inducible protein F [Pseudonocardia autotrophica]TDN76747.1 putative MATE family efflux protein [Pseudonocardia autotrophica]BBG00748.1 MATE family efflux transporter [Pseudonocardia autotrophica]GEC24286.1 MATE family efflux transporter [Pseudonocardia saturnea]